MVNSDKITSCMYEFLFFRTMTGIAKFDVEGNMKATFSKAVSSFLSWTWCLNCNMYGFSSIYLMLSLGIGEICTKSVLPMSVECLKKMSVCSLLILCNLSFVLTYIVVWFKLTFLWQLTSAGDVITLELLG